MKFSSLSQAAQFRITECEENYYIEDYWNAAVEIFTKNIDATIAFFKNDCTDEELFWLSEIFEKVAKISQSKELISVLRSRLAEVKPEKYNQANFKSKFMQKWIGYNDYIKSIGDEIDFAEGQLKE